MRVAYIKLRNDNPSSIIKQTITEEIRSQSINVEFTPTHVVFKLYNGNIFAFESNMVISVFVSEEIYPEDHEDNSTINKNKCNTCGGDCGQC